MRILITAATGPEIKPLADLLNIDFNTEEGRCETVWNMLDLTLLITGVGIVPTTFHTLKELSRNTYDLAINIGIAGAFDRSLALAEVVEVVEDSLPELGAEDHDEFISASEMGILGNAEWPIGKSGIIENNFSANAKTLNALRKVKSATVNTVHGNEQSIQQFQMRCNADIESMEGAAFFFTCMNTKTSCIQLRSISNYIEKRNRLSWRITEAINSLSLCVFHLINEWAKPLNQENENDEN
jgi:futalosine hydrolase